MKLTHADYDRLYNIVFEDNYRGYKPTIIESPNGDKNWDTEKQYAHIAKKYLEQLYFSKTVAYSEQRFLWRILTDGLVKARQIADELLLPPEFYPSIEDSTIRILDYPPGAITHPHTDFDLFTVMLYRDKPKCFRYLDEPPSKAIQELSPHIHYGEILELIDPTLKATKHEVIASNHTQASIVFFAMPPHSAILPSGQTVGEWVAERLSRSRKEIT